MIFSKLFHSQAQWSLFYKQYVGKTLLNSFHLNRHTIIVILLLEVVSSTGSKDHRVQRLNKTKTEDFEPCETNRTVESGHALLSLEPA